MKRIFPWAGGSGGVSSSRRASGQDEQTDEQIERAKRAAANLYDYPRVSHRLTSAQSHNLKSRTERFGQNPSTPQINIRLPLLSGANPCVSNPWRKTCGWSCCGSSRRTFVDGWGELLLRSIGLLNNPEFAILMKRAIPVVTDRGSISESGLFRSRQRGI